MLSVVVACFNEEVTIPILFEELMNISKKIPEKVELIFVNDGSTDRSLEQMKDIQKKHSELVTYISFSRNFGKEAALIAGLRQAKGEYVCVMDADMQDPPELLVEMYERIQDESIDCVGARRVTRKGEPLIRSFFARLFYKVVNRIGNVEMVDGARDFRLMSRQMVESILELTEYNRFSKGLFSWVGYRTVYLEYENRERVAGTTSWSFWKLVSYSIDGIINFSEMPLNMASYIGAMSCGAAALAMVFIVVRALLFGDQTSGWPSLVTIILFVGGIQLLCMGIIGKYIAKIFMETKKRPLYIIKEQQERQEQIKERSESETESNIKG